MQVRKIAEALQCDNPKCECHRVSERAVPGALSCP